MIEYPSRTLANGSASKQEVKAGMLWVRQILSAVLEVSRVLGPPTRQIRQSKIIQHVITTCEIPTTVQSDGDAVWVGQWEWFYSLVLHSTTSESVASICGKGPGEM